ncbi:flavin reductase family protein [Streptomyces nogalater]|uniref:NADPH-flavin oxidoreductase n=2 Tax=Streptomyces TaxID=1883 RepID=VLMR_STRVF|nr:RecName: Full=NADPH-flavin oxidoreductase; AltName: Full=FAD reductase (NADPH); AltName: Full=FMN reductase (NADPH); AltName: Full=Isobutylamine N-hydroxylase, reductase component [Streptomyces viridifaciens]AAC45645.1 NADPH-flavin oxidoreductase [Streptomyces viridifaciens]AAN10239.1 FAD reductase [Streptomyces viridifaciens]
MTPSAAATGHEAADEQRLRELRGLTRQLPTGVAVVTAQDGEVAHGATVSTVSVLSQQPLRIGVSLRRGSYLTGLIRQRRVFALNVLSSRQSAVADWFANPERPRGWRQFDYVRWTAHPKAGMPVLEDALAQLHCRLTDLIPLGASDDLLVAEVLDGRGRNGRPLVNFNGRLHDVEFRGVVRVSRDQPSAVTSLE